MSSYRQKLIKDLRLSLGEGLVRVGLKPEHYDFAIDYALDRYRLRSSNSVEERNVFLELQPGQTEYILPDTIMEVKKIFRRGTTGTAGGTGVNFDPFSSSYVNQLIISGGPGTSNLLTYELFAGYQELLGRMFGQNINFSWNSSSHRLEIVRYIRAPETVLLWVYMSKTEEELFNDVNSRTWLRDYSLAKCKLMLGEARSKFQSVPGPQGGTTLNGDALKAEATSEMERLELEVSTQMEQSMSYGFIIG